jgi:hypothetical protein
LEFFWWNGFFLDGKGYKLGLKLPSIQACDRSWSEAVAVDKIMETTAAIESITNVKSPSASHNRAKKPLHSILGFSLL